MFLKKSQNSLENTCAGVSFIIMLRAVASLPCQEYIKVKILTHVRHFFHKIHFFFLSQLYFDFWSSLWKVYIVFKLWCWYQKRIQESWQTFKMEFFAKIIYGLKPLTIFAKNSILDIWQDSQYSIGWMDGYYNRGFSEQLVIYLLNL